MTAIYEWYETYKAACWNRLVENGEERIQAAKSDLLIKRKEQLSLDHGGTPEENQAIEEAIRSLEVLRKDAMSWSNRGAQGDRKG